VIKRHGYKGGRATHGSMFHRAPGSIGASAYPSRVYPGTRLPGHMGDARVTVKNAKVVKVDADRNLLFIKGGVPGARNSYVRIVKAT
jgi:large subunit ribosomal protein L3